ncbi:MAG: Gfo/Idh/MocA family oxidoreductase [Candidatus Omnitrophota bacterium]
MLLNPENKLLGRRNFIKAAMALPPLGAVALKASGIGPVKTGIVGTGMEGRILITLADPKYLNIAASCDIRPDNRALGHELIKKPELKQCPNPALYENYEDMLNDSGLEAVIIASPLHLHGPMAIQALKAGKHVFVEKTMAYSEEECAEMIRLAENNNLVLQAGHQRFYNPLYWDAYRMLNEGLLGSVYHIRAMWHRNTDWNYWTHAWKEDSPEQIEQLKRMQPQKYGYPDLQHLVNWRWYGETSHGLWTELCSHQIAIANWFFDSMPTAVYAAGGAYKTQQDQEGLYKELNNEYEIKKKYNDTPAKTFAEYRSSLMAYGQDDRSIADHIYAIFEYPNNRTVTYSSIQSSSVDQYYEQIMGTRGTIVLSNENETYLFWESGWDEQKAEKAAKEEKSTQIEVVKEDASASAFAAHTASQQATGGGGASEMTPYEPYRYELQGFSHSIRSGSPNLCDGRRGAMAAKACFYGEKAMRERKRIEIPSILA